jgi:hypothetical protein
MPPFLDEAMQDSDWQILYRQCGRTLSRYGVEGVRRTADFWIDDNIRTRQHKIYVRNLELLRSDVIEALQRLLGSFPDWSLSSRFRSPAWAMLGRTWG